MGLIQIINNNKNNNTSIKNNNHITDILILYFSSFNIIMNIFYFRMLPKKSKRKIDIPIRNDDEALEPSPSTLAG